MTLCGGTEEVAGDWWAWFVSGYGRVRLEELTTRWVPVECISGFSSHTPLINVGGGMYVPYPTL